MMERGRPDQTVYTFEAPGIAMDYPDAELWTRDYAEARAYARDKGYQVIANEYEWEDSSLIDDFMPVTWTVQAPAVTEGGDVGGDYQAGEAWSVRLASAQVPGAMINLYAFAEALRVNHGMGEVPSGEYCVQVMTEYLTCTDTADPGGTETWSDMVYATRPDVYATTGDADRDARKLAEAYAAHPEAFGWDGEPFWAGRPEIRELPETTEQEN
jgi:hypothetical protein